MNKEKLLIEFWRQLNIEFLMDTQNLAAEETIEPVSDTAYYPIDKEICIIEVDSVGKFLLMQSNGKIYKFEEMVEV